MRAAYSITKKPASTAFFSVDVNAWLTAIGATLASYAVTNYGDMTVAQDDEANVLLIEATGGTSGSIYELLLTVTPSIGAARAMVLEVINVGVAPAPTPAPTPSPGPGPSPSPTPSPGEISWGVIGGDITANSALNAALQAKASKTELQAKADATALQSVADALNQKADAQAVSTALQSKVNVLDMGAFATSQQLANAIGDKVTATTLANAIGNKADTTAVNAKADKSYVDTQLSAKASMTDVNTALGQKADVSVLGAKADKTALDLKADTAHSHDISTLQSALAWVQSQIDARLQLYALISGAPAPAPTPSTPTPAPAPGAGTGATETVAPVFDESKPMGIRDNGDGSYTAIVTGRGWPSTGNSAVDYFKVQPKVAGTVVAGQIGTYYVDQSSASRELAFTYGAYTSDIGQLLGFVVTAYNEAAPNGVTVHIPSIIVGKASNTGVAGATGGSTVAGGLALQSMVLAPNVTIPSSALSFMVMPSLAGFVTKAGGESLVAAMVGNVYDDAGNGTTTTTAWSGGTPIASGTSNTAVASNWNEVGAGYSWTVLADTTERIFFLNCSVFSGTVTLACELSDGSAASKTFEIPSETTLAVGATSAKDVSVNRLIAVRFKAGSAGKTAKFTAKMTEINPGTSGGGNSHLSSVYVVAA